MGGSNESVLQSRTMVLLSHLVIGNTKILFVIDLGRKHVRGEAPNKGKWK